MRQHPEHTRATTTLSDHPFRSISRFILLRDGSLINTEESNVRLGIQCLVPSEDNTQHIISVPDTTMTIGYNTEID